MDRQPVGATGRARRRLGVSLLLVPFVVSGFAIGISSPAHAETCTDGVRVFPCPTTTVPRPTTTTVPRPTTTVAPPRTTVVRPPSTTVAPPRRRTRTTTRAPRSTATTTTVAAAPEVTAVVAPVATTTTLAPSTTVEEDATTTTDGINSAPVVAAGFELDADEPSLVPSTAGGWVALLIVGYGLALIGYCVWLERRS